MSFKTPSMNLGRRKNYLIHWKRILIASQPHISSTDVSHHVVDIYNNGNSYIDKDDLDDMPSFHALLDTNALLSLNFEKHTKVFCSKVLC
jgi:hypothetical protein